MQKDYKEVRVAMNRQDPPYGCLTNGAHYPFTLNGKTWTTVDHYFHAQKFAGTPLEETIRRCKTAKQAGRAGRAKGAPVRQDWDKIRHNVMYEGLMAKFKQNAGPRRVLRSTGTATIVGLMGKEDFWGAGKDGKGKNKWGELLMNVRLLLDGVDDDEGEAEEEKKTGGKRKRETNERTKKRGKGDDEDEDSEEEEEEEKPKEKGKKEKKKKKEEKGKEKKTEKEEAKKKLRGVYTQVEYASSCRANCRVCWNKIPKGELRMGKLSFSRKFDGTICEWHHLNCFLKRYTVEAAEAPSIKGLDDIRWEDKEKLLNTFGASPSKKRKREAEKEVGGDDDEGEGEAEAEEGDESEPRDNFAETGDEEDEAMKLQNKKLWALKDELRKNCTRDELKELLEFNSQQAKGGKMRLLDRCAECMLFGAMPLCPECKTGVIVPWKGVFRCTGFATAWSKCTFTKESIDRLEWKIPDSTKNEYLQSFKFTMEKQVVKKVVEPEKKERKKSTTPSPKKAKTVKMVVKGNSAIDPKTGLSETGRIYEEKDGTKYNVVLNMSDVVTGANAYYNLQVIEDEKAETWHVWRKWGRVGTWVGSSKLDKCATARKAVELFERVYLDKTGNRWADRDEFEKQPGKYYPVDIDYGIDDSSLKAKAVDPNKPSQLQDNRIKDLLGLIFNMENMEKTMAEMEIDINKMPLGRLSEATIKRGYTVLSKIQEVLDDTELEEAQRKNSLIELSNQFYTIVPHAFGLSRPTIIDHRKLVKNKIEMLNTLSEMQLAIKLLREGEDTDDVLWANYQKLKTNIVPVAPEEKEFKLVSKYLRQTHAPSHSQYSLELLDLFKIDREGEMTRYEKWAKLHNRMLLWHGSRLTNWAGILSQGLRIAPPEAPSTGYMFGKGVYFADMASKSANYCFTSRENNVGIMTLSEVALGDMYQLLHSKYMDKPPAGYHSTKGCGQTEPDPSTAVLTKEGVKVPCGEPSKSGAVGSSLLYNEYIVYDVGQINIKYLLKVKFNYK